MEQSVKTTCAYCGVGCGVIATPQKDGSVTIAGDTSHPANFGRLCSKGSALGETVDLDGRLLVPKVNGVETSWDETLDLVASTFKETIKTHGPDSVAFYVSGQLLTEDYYVANKLMKGFIGSANIDTNSRLCMSSSVAGHKRAFGEDVVPGNYEDLEQADLLVLVGSNAAWCHPVLYQRMMAAQEADMSKKIVVLDPRATSTTESANLHLDIKPGTDAFVFQGLLAFLANNEALDHSYMQDHVTGATEAISLAVEQFSDLDGVARHCGLPAGKLQRFYEMFLETEKVVTLYSQGINQSSSGTDKVNSILNVHLATGRISKPGMGPFSLTGQPNAMGGREVGGLANMLASHMDIGNPDHTALLADFWDSETVAHSQGLKAVDMFDAVDSGKIKNIWIMCTNPAVSMPDAEFVSNALKKCDFVVVSDIMEQTETTQLATVLLPALGWGEKDGVVTNSERRMSRQRAFLPPPGQAKADWEIITEVAKRMGFQAQFTYRSSYDVFMEYVASTALNAGSERQLNLSGLNRLTQATYDALDPVQWPVINGQMSDRLYGDGQFSTASGKAIMLPIEPRLPAMTLSDAYPLTLNTGRVRDHWHTMTRTAKSPRLSTHIPEPYVDIHPDDADYVGLTDGALAAVTSEKSTAIVRVVFNQNQSRGHIFIPIHWNGPYASNSRVCALIDARVDPVSGQPELKQTAVTVQAYEPAWHAFVLTANDLPVQSFPYQVIVNGDGFVWQEYAGDDGIDDWQSFAENLLQKQAGDELATYQDTNRGVYRFGLVRRGMLIACLFVARDHSLVPRNWLGQLINSPLTPADRASLLSGRPSSAQDVGPTVCACFGIGTNKIIETIQDNQLTTVAEIGELLKAGTNCGSCKPELAKLLKGKA